MKVIFYCFPLELSFSKLNTKYKIKYLKIYQFFTHSFIIVKIKKNIWLQVQRILVNFVLKMLFSKNFN